MRTDLSAFHGVNSGKILASHGNGFVEMDIKDVKESIAATTDGGQFKFTGVGQDGQSGNPTVYLQRGRSYRITIDSTFVAGGHTLMVQTHADNLASSYYLNHSRVGYFDYSDANKNAGYLDWYVTDDTPDTLYFVCYAHPTTMISTIIVGGPTHIFSNTTVADSYSGLVPPATAANFTTGITNVFLRGDATWAEPPVGAQSPPGLLFPFGGASIPSGYLLCDGAAVSRTTYSALFAVIGVNFGGGDGSTTFNIPDTRGRFIRGVDGGVGRDPDRLTRTGGDVVGSTQGDDFRSHTHDFTDERRSGESTVDDPDWLSDTVNVNQGSNTGSRTSTATGGSETRPINIGLHYIIKT